MIILILERVSIHFLSRNKIIQKKLVSEEFQFFNGYEDYIMNYLKQIEIESDDVLDMLTHKNTKYLFYQFSQYLVQIRQTLKLIRNCNSRR